MRRVILLVTVLAALTLVGGARAMESTHYRIEWLMASVGSGDEAASTQFRAQFTLGQAVIGRGESAHYKGQWGYWPGGGQPPAPPALHLPVVMRGS